MILTYLHERRVGADYDSRGSYSSGPEAVDDRHGHSNAARFATMGAAGAGLAALGKHFRRRSRSRSPTDDSSQRTPISSVDEKHSRDDHHSGWGKRFLGVGAALGAAGLAKKLFDRRRDRERDDESGRYRPARARSDSLYDDSLSRIEEARPRPSHSHTYDGAARPPSSYSDSGITYDSRDRHGGRNAAAGAAAGAGAFAAFRGLFKSRKQKEQDRIEEIRRADIENERLARNNSKRRYTGDGHPPRRPTRRHSPVSSYTGPTDSETVDQSAPPIPPSHQDVDSEAYGPGRRHHRYHSMDPGDSALGGGGPTTMPPPSGHNRRNDGPAESVASPPVSLKVRVQDDGRRVTLRRLTEEEIAAQRRAKRRGGRRAHSRRRHGSVSSASGNESSDRWRRVEELERRQQAQMQREAAASTVGPGPSTVPPGPAPAPSGDSGPLPPPPIPPGMGNISSPMSTDISGSHASKRDRRRAERRTSRQGRHNVEFT